MRVRKTNSALVLNSCEVIYDLSWFLWSLGHAVNTVNSKWYYTVVLYILCVIVSKYIHVFHFDCYNPILMPSTCICIHSYVCLYVCIPGLCVLPWFIHSFIHFLTKKTRHQQCTKCFWSRACSYLLTFSWFLVIQFFPQIKFV